MCVCTLDLKRINRNQSEENGKKSPGETRELRTRVAQLATRAKLGGGLTNGKERENGSKRVRTLRNKVDNFKMVLKKEKLSMLHFCSLPLRKFSHESSAFNACMPLQLTA